MLTTSLLSLVVEVLTTSPSASSQITKKPRLCKSKSDAEVSYWEGGEGGFQGGQVEVTIRSSKLHLNRNKKTGVGGFLKSKTFTWEENIGLTMAFYTPSSIF